MCFHQGLSSKVRPLSDSGRPELKRFLSGDCDNRRDDKMQVIRVSCVTEVGCLLV